MLNRRRLLALASIAWTSATFATLRQVHHAYFREDEGDSPFAAVREGHKYSIGRSASREANLDVDGRATSASLVAGPSREEGAVAEFASNFAFPSPQERVEYYMGDWSNRTLSPDHDDMPCHELDGINSVVSDETVLWSAGALEREIRANTTKNWLIRAYLINAFEVVRDPDNGGGGFDENSFVLFLGDSHSHSTTLPVVAKTRFSRFTVERQTGRRFFSTIIWPMEMHRHYFPVTQYFRLEAAGGVTKWEDKRPTLIWRGGVTGIESDKNLSSTYPIGGPRLHVVSAYFTANVSDVDVAFKSGDASLRTVPHKYRNVRSLARSSHTSMAGQLRFKYILNLEGNDVATGLKWQLASNSVVFMARPTTVSFLMEDVLVPYVHYVPLRDDYSDVLDMVRWARENDAKCRWMSEQATSYMRRLWTSEEARRDNAVVKKELGGAYQRQFGGAVKSCFPSGATQAAGALT